MLLYENDVTLTTRTLCIPRDHLEALQSFCKEVGMIMNVNMGKTRIVVLFLEKGIKTSIN
jgi:hypothetical protein